MAIMDSAKNITPQWYIETLERYAQQLRHVADVMNHIRPNLRDWHENTEGEVTAVGLPLAALAPETDKGNPLLNVMTKMLLRIGNGSLNAHGLR